jgi:hypothetical protein
VLWADRRFKLGHGRAFALYVMAYTVGRAWIEYLRIDEAHHILGLRLNDWTSIVVFAGALAYFVIVGRRHPGREAPDSIDPIGVLEEAEASAATAAEPVSEEQAVWAEKPVAGKTATEELVAEDAVHPDGTA